MIAIVRKKDVTLDNLRLENLKWTGVAADHGEDVRITNCHFEKLNWALSLPFSRRAQVMGNRIIGTPHHGIQFWGNWQWEQTDSEDLLFANNYVKNGGGGPIWGTGARRVVMTGNLIDGAEDVGLELEWCEDSVISGNTVRNCGNAGISLFFACKRVSITGNTIVNDHAIDDPNAAWWVRSGIWLTPPNREAFKRDHGHEDIAIVGNTIRCADGERRERIRGGSGWNGTNVKIDRQGEVCEQSSSKPPARSASSSTPPSLCPKTASCWGGARTSGCAGAAWICTSARDGGRRQTGRQFPAGWGTRTSASWRSLRMRNCRRARPCWHTPRCMPGSPTSSPPAPRAPSPSPKSPTRSASSSRNHWRRCSAPSATCRRS
ncbi:MAG: right-handed parallel beta-helix repeat-containing protein [Armatimonadetes bacterium]|nr:right-handed parallel beta-helix repeat-containing protein [Armatimonadota bacterium]